MIYKLRYQRVKTEQHIYNRLDDRFLLPLKAELKSFCSQWLRIFLIGLNFRAPGLLIFSNLNTEVYYRVSHRDNWGKSSHLLRLIESQEALEREQFHLLIDLWIFLCSLQQPYPLKNCLICKLRSWIERRNRYTDGGTPPHSRFQRK